MKPTMIPKEPSQQSRSTPRRVLVVLTLLIAFDGCGLFSGLAEGRKQADTMAAAIETRIGVKPEISFSVFNGKLVRLSVEFASVPTAALREIETIVRQEAQRAFKGEPDDLIIAFSFKKTA